MRLVAPFLAAAATAPLASAITLDLSSTDSIKQAASTAAWGLVNIYTGNQTGQVPGLLPQPYYWWECGAMFGALINYWYYTGDSTYNDIVTQGLLFQTGDFDDYMPQNQTRDEGNDDQVFWGFAVMEAAEYKFPNPPSDGPQWLELAQGVFNSQANRWDNATCDGGLRWQIFTWNNGYDYKNSAANAGFLNMASRLYKYTGNETYAKWVDSSWGWMEGVGLIGTGGGVYDGTDVDINCTAVNHDQWTYTAGMVIHAAAVMWNMTQDPVWQQRLELVWAAAQTKFFTSDMIMIEYQCELSSTCDLDELTFKAYLARFLAAASKVAPFFWDTVQPYLSASAAAAASQCDGAGPNGNTQVCGFSWPKTTTWDGTTGVGQQMSALEVIQVNLSPEAAFPVSSRTGGISKGNAAAGSTGDSNSNSDVPLTPITGADRAGAIILTGLICVLTVGGGWLLIRH